MKTNELEKEIGLSKYTIRYYEKEGLIQPKREENGYRDYDDETVQKLKIIKFLRNLQISVDDIKAILDGELDFRHCLKINQVNMQKQIESMNEIKDTIDDYYDKDLPLIEELSEIKNNNNKMGLGFQKTTSTVSLGRKLTPELARRQLIITFIGALVVAMSFARMPYDLGNMRVLVGIVFFIVTFMLMIAFSFKQTSAMMLDNILNQSVEFLSDGIYYPLEGYLAPETYFLTQEDTIESITKMMLDQTQKHLEKYKTQILDFKVNSQPLTVHQFMTLSSIVQRESPVNDEDRQLVCGVLINRLNKQMPLQCDVTVNYGNQEVKIDVKHTDLNKDTKYNTYKYNGLPVGPISSISTGIIKNVLNYKESEYYYFFATQDGKVLYAKTYQEHQANVNSNKWY